MASTTLRLTVDAADAVRGISALAELAEASLEIRQAAVDLVDRLPEFVGLDLDDRPASQAGQLRVRLELPDLLLALADALRARAYSCRSGGC